MRTFKASLGIAILGAVTTACATGVQPVQPMIARVPAQTFNGPPQVELLIALKPGYGIDELRALGAKHGFSVSRYWPQIQSAAIRLERFGSTRNVMTALQGATSVAHVELGGTVTPEVAGRR